MTTVVVGGHSRNVGKTSVVAGLIAAFSQYPWTAVKISSHRHAGSAVAGMTGTAVPDVYEEKDPRGGSDTSRFLAAGALRSLWVRGGADNLESAMQQLMPILRSSLYALIESNRILRFIQPDLYILVLRCDIEDFKDSARETLSRADAIVAVGSGSIPPAWRDALQASLERIPVFRMPDLQSIPKELVDFVQSRLFRK
jgi:hypothetical protein